MAFLLSGIALGIWVSVQPNAEGEQFLISLLTFFLGLKICFLKSTVKIQKDNLILGMEMKCPNAQKSLFSLLKEGNKFDEEWTRNLSNEKWSLLKFESLRILKLLATIPILQLLFFGAFPSTPQPLKIAMKKVTDVVSHLNQGSYLKILEGSPDSKKNIFKLSKEKSSFELLADNMIEVSVIGKKNDIPFQLHLKRNQSENSHKIEHNPIFQSFQLSRDEDNTTNQKYSVTFSVSEDVEIYLSHISENEPVAIINVKQLPIPKVNLKIKTELKVPWPDDMPLPLQIDVSAENPIQQVRLIIKTDGKSFKELVNNVMADNIKQMSNNYSLILESYLQRDTGEIEIIAEVIDRSLPVPLIGRSRPILINTASAYGRYRQTLQTLKEIKSIIDETKSNNENKLDSQTTELIDKALNQSLDSPFFDGLDRVYLNRYQLALEDLASKFELEKLLDLSQSLDDFLFEHEILDDKERDRDFFVAARTLSRLIEKPRKERTLSTTEMVDRINHFLDNRYLRWEIRVNRLGQTAPKLWSSIKKRPFVSSMKQISSLENIPLSRYQSEKSLEILSNSVNAYKAWIESLELAEENSRKEQEKKRQKGLISAQNTLRELQKRQGKISTKLDRAIDKNQQLEKNWPGIRMDQNSNIKETKGVEAQLRALSPHAGKRVRGAMEAMALTREAGNRGAFSQAESGSDLAGRLLRQAESAARKAQRSQQRRGKRRRVTGDNYYGSQIAGGDVEIKRGYQVNRRYREDILDDMSKQRQENKNDQNLLLESFLRRVIR